MRALLRALGLLAVLLSGCAAVRASVRASGVCVARCESDPRAHGHMCNALRDGDTCVCATWATPGIDDGAGDTWRIPVNSPTNPYIEARR